MRMIFETPVDIINSNMIVAWYEYNFTECTVPGTMVYTWRDIIISYRIHN